MAEPRPVTTATPARLSPRWFGLFVRLVLGVLGVAGFVVALRSGFGLLWFVPYAVMGTVLIVRRPRMPIGWLLLMIGSFLVVQVMPVDATPEQFSAGTVPWPLLILSVVAGGPLGISAFVLFAYLAMVFPSGRLPDGRWGRIARIVTATVGVLIVVSSFGPTINVNLIGAPNGANVRNPLAIAPEAAVWQILNPSVGFVLVTSLLIGGAVSLVIRHRRARGVERQQLAWVVAAMAFVPIAVVGGIVLGGLMPQALDEGLIWIPAIFAFATVPMSVGIAVLRYRLYEIDRIVSRTISWAMVSAVLVVVFIAFVLVTQAALAPITSSNTLAVAGSTLVVAALFQPLRRRVQTRVDRRFNRARYDAERTVTALAGRLRNDVDIDQLRAEITTTVGRTVQPASVSLWLRERPRAGPKAGLA